MSSANTDSKAAPKAKAGKKSGEGGGIQSLHRASAILDAVAARPEGISLAELSVAVGLHTSTAFHLIKTLVTLGFIEQDGTDKRYSIGSRVFALAAGALDENAMLDQATPLLERLSTETGEASHLAVRSNRDIFVIARTAATGLLQLSDRSGALRPAHATAIGKMLLACMGDEDLDRLLGDLPLPRLTENTITDRRKLRRELSGIRKDGIAHDRQELDMDVRCIAVPVHDFAGRVVAAMGISGPVWRMSGDVIEPKTDALFKAADELSERLGYREPQAAE